MNAKDLNPYDEDFRQVYEREILWGVWDFLQIISSRQASASSLLTRKGPRELASGEGAGLKLSHGEVLEV